MYMKEMIKCLEKGEIFPKFPRNRNSSYSYRLRNYCIDYGMWAIVTKTWTKKLSKWIGNRKVLEIMSGAGWLSKALYEHGIDIKSTDNASWDKNHVSMKRWFPVEIIEGGNAVKKYKNSSDILLVSWPPYAENRIEEICDLWGKEKPIIYIGEGNGGCCATDKFFNKFIPDTKIDIRIPSWRGMDDYLMIGKWF